MVATLSSEGMGGVIPQPESFADYQSFFHSLVVVYRCASLNASQVATAKLRFYRDLGRGKREELVDPQHPLLRLFGRPNPKTSGRRWRLRHQLGKELVGSAYSEIVSKPVAQLYNLNPGAMTAETNGRAVTGWSYKPGREAQSFTTAEVWDDRFVDPDDEIYGMPPIRSAKSNIIANLQLEKALESILKNGMRLSGYLAVETAINPKQEETLMNNLRELYSGVRNWGKTLVVPGGREFTPLNMEPERFQASESSMRNTAAVRHAYGVPSLVYGEDQASWTRDNALSQVEQYHYGTIVPRARDLDEEITERLIPMLRIKGTEGVIAESDFYDTPVERRLRVEEARANGSLVDRGILTANEVRTELGYEPVPWGDSKWGPSGEIEQMGPQGERQEQSTDKALLHDVSRVVRELAAFSEVAA